MMSRPWLGLPGVIGTIAPGLLLLLLAGCAGGPGGPGGSLADEPAAVPTASDQTDAERRARVRLELATAYYSRGQLDTALDEVKLALQTSPANSPTAADAYQLRGLVYAAMGQDRLADDSFRRALAINPRDGGVMHNQAWWLCQRNQHAEAQALFNQALAVPGYRDVARTQLARGVCLARAGQWLEAEGALMRAHELDPSNPSVAFSLAEVLLRRGELERARFYINRVNDTAGASNAQTLWLAARIEHKAGRTLPLRVLGDQLRNRYPQSPEAALFDRGQFDD